MNTNYQHLGIFSDLVAEAQRQQPLYPLAKPGIETQRLVRETLGFNNGAEIPQAVRSERCWEKDGIAGEEVSWSVGYGPRTHAYLLKPLGASGALPGVVALHDHGGFKFYGKEKIAEGADETVPVQNFWWKSAYGGRAYANALARQGFTVLVPDVFLWGSRKFPIETMPEHMRDAARLQLAATPPPADMPYEIAEYNTTTTEHEHLVSKYCNLLGTDMAGVVSHEDRIAVNYLLSRPDVLPGGVGCVGLSGGGNRGALLQATHSRVRAAVIVGLMSTYAGLLDHNVASHTWMFFPLGWARYGDWSDLTACRAPSPLLVQYDLEDPLFTLEGMRAAHERIAAHYASVGQPQAYTGQFYPGEHKFDLEMQEAAFKWLKNTML
jgi:dienelactone hydrolase